FSSISMLVQTSLLEITLLSGHHFHSLLHTLPLCYQATEAPQVLQRQPWHMPCKRAMEPNDLGRGVRRGTERQGVSCSRCVMPCVWWSLLPACVLSRRQHT